MSYQHKMAKAGCSGGKAGSCYSGRGSAGKYSSYGGASYAGKGLGSLKYSGSLGRPGYGKHYAIGTDGASAFGMYKTGKETYRMGQASPFKPKRGLQKIDSAMKSGQDFDRKYGGLLRDLEKSNKLYDPNKKEEDAMQPCVMCGGIAPKGSAFCLGCLNGIKN